MKTEYSNESQVSDMPFQTVAEAVDWIINHEMDSNRTDISRIQSALDLLDNPQQGLPVIHLTGTNGKGSTTAFTKELLISQGLKVASFTSPHIVKINERIQFDGHYIPDEDLFNYAQIIYDLNQKMEEENLGSLRFFEIMTIMAALYFRDVQPDVCLVEVGIGGLLDNTNIFDGQVAVITTIGLDHTDKLGNTLKDIAFQKAGIIKPSAHVVTGRITDDSAIAEIEKAVRLNDATHHAYQDNYQAFDVRIDENKLTHFTFKNESVELDMMIKMLGQFQVDNASVAIEVCLNWMEIAGLTVNVETLKEAVKNTFWPARLEKLNDSPFIYIDGAHNVLGLEALKQALKDYFSDKKITMLYSGLTKKDQEAHLNLLSTYPVKEVVLTEFDFVGEVLSIDDAHEVVEDHDTAVHFTDTDNWQTYIDQFIENKSDQEMLIITGSLYFVSQVRDYFK